MRDKQIKSAVKIAVIVIFILTAFLFVACQSTANDTSSDTLSDDFVVFTINGEPVTFRELNNSVLHVRGNVISSSIVQGANLADEDFWHTPINGITPAENLIQEAIDRAARIKIIQMEAMEHGLIDDISYSGFMAALLQENMRRQTEIEQGGIIFGPQSYSEELFFDIQASELEENLNRWLAPLMGATEEELREFYESEWQNTPTEAGWIFIEKLYVPFMPTGFLFPDEAWHIAQEILIYALSGEGFEEIAERHDYVEVTTQFLGLRRGEGNIGQRASIQTAFNFNTGDISAVYEDLNSWAILRVLDRNEVVYQTYEDLWEHMQRAMAARNFAEFIDELTTTAEIEINDEAIEQTKVLITE